MLVSRIKNCVHLPSYRRFDRNREVPERRVPRPGEKYDNSYVRVTRGVVLLSAGGAINIVASSPSSVHNIVNKKSKKDVFKMSKKESWWTER